MYFKILLFLIPICNSARILGVFPAPFPSHQSVFRSLTLELVKRGHEMVVITTDPAFKHNSPTNLREINVHDISYEVRNKYPVKTGKIDDIYHQIDTFFDMFGEVVEAQLNTTDVQNLINNKSESFDLILVEGVIRPALIFTHFFKAPVIMISSLGSMDLFTKGISDHAITNPNILHQKLHQMTLWEKAKTIYNNYLLNRLIESKEANENEMLKRNFGSDVPPLSQLKKNVEMLMLNVHHLWEDNCPVPPNVIYLGGLHLENNDTRMKQLSSGFKSYLDSSINGVIYMSLGSLVMPSLLDNMDVVLQAFSKLPYDVLLKWDYDQLLGCPSNVKIVKWVPQKQLLRHPNVKLFITQGGLQSIDEAIVAGVPVVGIPILGDQWYNVEKFVHLKIGLRLDLEDITEKKMLDAIKTVIDDNSYRRNMLALGKTLYDRPQSSLDRAVWWTEYIIRHGRLHHLNAPSSDTFPWEYVGVDGFMAFVACVVSLLCAITITYIIFKENIVRKP